MRGSWQTIEAMLPQLIILATVLMLGLSGCTQRTLDAGPLATPPLENARIAEASGMAMATVVDDAVWLLNDSGHPPQLFLAGLDGTDLGTTWLEGARNVDWEAMSRFDLEGESWLVVADVGDNAARRDDLVLYFIQEPAPPLPGHTPVAHQMALEFPDGARDVEGIAVDPRNSEIIVLSKRDALPRLYSLPLEGALKLNRMTASYQGTVSSIPPPTRRDLVDSPVAGVAGFWISQPTGLSISEDGSEAVILTYKRAYRYRRDTGQSWLQALNSTPETVDVFQQPKVEAVTYLPDGRIVIASEGANQPMLLINP